MLGLFGDIIPCLREALARSLESLDVSSEESSIRALQGTYLERGCVHVCTQLYTRGYTVVYTRVYSRLLGSRYKLGMSTPRAETLLSSESAP